MKQSFFFATVSTNSSISRSSSWQIGWNVFNLDTWKSQTALPQLPKKFYGRRTIHWIKMVCKLYTCTCTCMHTDWLSLSLDFVIIHVASQMWLLGRMIPPMLGHLIPEDDQRWMNLTLLLRILQQLLAQSVTVDECVHLMVSIIRYSIIIIYY